MMNSQGPKDMVPHSLREPHHAGTWEHKPMAFRPGKTHASTQADISKSSIKVNNKD